MLIVYYTIRLVLVAVFVLSGFTKLKDPIGSRQAVLDFGLPSRIAMPVATCLPYIELAIAFFLLVDAFAWLGGISSMLLLLIFSIAIGYNLLQGNSPECRCFGEFSSKPIGVDSLVRNGLLMCSSAIIILASGRYEFADLLNAISYEWSFSRLEYALMCIISLLIIGVSLQGWLTVQLLKQNGRILQRLDLLEQKKTSPSPASKAGLPIGSRAPSFTLADIREANISLSDLCLRNKPLVLIFVDVKCNPCQAMLPTIVEWQKRYSSQLTIALVSRGKAEDVDRIHNRYHLDHVLVQEDNEIADLFMAYGTPAAVLVTPDGHIGSTLKLGSRAIGGLVAEQTDLVPDGLVPALA